MARTVGKYLSDPGYIFFLGNTDPKKNTSGTLRAYAEYVRRSEKPQPLLVADLREQGRGRRFWREIGAPELRGAPPAGVYPQRRPPGRLQRRIGGSSTPRCARVSEFRSSKRWPAARPW